MPRKERKIHIRLKNELAKCFIGDNGTCGRTSPNKFQQWWYARALGVLEKEEERTKRKLTFKEKEEERTKRKLAFKVFSPLEKGY